MGPAAQHRDIIDVTPETMSEDTRESGSRPQGSALAKTLLVLALVVLAGVSAALYYAYDYWMTAREELLSVHERISAARSAQEALVTRIEDTRGAVDAQQVLIQAQAERLRQQDKAIASQEGAIEARRETLDRERQAVDSARKALERRLDEASRRLEGTPDRWLVAETASLLRIADSKLALANDRDRALAALERADALLAQAGDKWQPVREVLADEIAVLEAYRPADVRRIADEILQLQRRATELQLKAAVIPLSEPPKHPDRPSTVEPAVLPSASQWQRAADKGIDALRGLVSIQRMHPGTLPAPTTPYRAYLRQHLRLQLDTARIAALSRDAALYTTSLQATRDLVSGFFAEGPARERFTTAISELAATPLDKPPPAVGDTLARLEAIQREAAAR